MKQAAKRIRALITGGGGQLATELAATAPASWEVETLGHALLDVTSRDAVFETLSKKTPRVVLNTAAYTKVDAAETDQQQAFAVNERGVENLAEACSRYGCRLIHVSTDFVFDGTKDRPYTTTDATRPINVYGQSKLAGEQKLLQLLPQHGSIFRTSWLYSCGGVNFVRTVLRLISERNQLGVVGDQFGSPTWARGLAKILWAAAKDDSLHGILHWADRGTVSWYEFAVAIQEEARAAGMVERTIPVRPLTTEEYPARAARPRYSVLDCALTVHRLSIPQTDWRVQLKSMISDFSTSLHSLDPIGPD